MDLDIFSVHGIVCLHCHPLCPAGVLTFIPSLAVCILVSEQESLQLSILFCAEPSHGGNNCIPTLSSIALCSRILLYNCQCCFGIEASSRHPQDRWLYHSKAIQLCIAIGKKYKQKILTIFTKQFYSCLSEITASSLVCFAFLL